MVTLPSPIHEIYVTSTVASILITPGSPVVLVTRIVPVAVVVMVVGVTICALFRFSSSVTIIWSVIIWDVSIVVLRCV